METMDTFGLVYSPGFALNEQIARQIFDILPEDGPMMIIVSPKGEFWPSSSETFSKLNLSDEFIKDLAAKVDDGYEPVITQVNDCSIIAASLVTDRTNCGYIILGLPTYTPESTMANLTILEILLSEIGLIAHLIEQNNLLYHRQMNQLVASTIESNDPAFN
jgi:hypothetical protein